MARDATPSPILPLVGSVVNSSSKSTAVVTQGYWAWLESILPATAKLKDVDGAGSCFFLAMSELMFHNQFQHMLLRELAGEFVRDPHRMLTCETVVSVGLTDYNYTIVEQERKYILERAEKEGRCPSGTTWDQYCSRFKEDSSMFAETCHLAAIVLLFGLKLRVYHGHNRQDTAAEERVYKPTEDFMPYLELHLDKMGLYLVRSATKDISFCLAKSDNHYKVMSYGTELEEEPEFAIVKVTPNAIFGGPKVAEMPPVKAEQPLVQAPLAADQPPVQVPIPSEQPLVQGEPSSLPAPIPAEQSSVQGEESPLPAPVPAELPPAQGEKPPVPGKLSPPPMQGESEVEEIQMIVPRKSKLKRRPPEVPLFDYDVMLGKEIGTLFDLSFASYSDAAVALRLCVV